jgi:ABC-type branched-subunit amino acid transport system ATPase component
MPIQSFDISSAKIVAKASCDTVPKLMIIAGRNGVGKSTLLNELRKFSGEKVKGSGKILYSPPHRTWRRRSIKSMWLWSPETEYSNILTLDSLPGFQGIPIQDPQRRYDTTDEAPGLIKYIIGQIETKRQHAIVSWIDKNDLKYPEGFAPDVYKPLREMLHILLPHLQFIGVDQSNRDNVRCLMRVEGVTENIDIDDLSSGEKEVIVLFMPLLERQINQIIRRMERGKEVDLESAPETVMLLDEPDLHIHPELQKRMLTYMRKRAYKDNVQFIIATHSPIMINEAASDELYSLVSKDVACDSNQLRRVISNQEKLDLFKDVCGDVAILTLGRPIVFIEGKAPQELKKAPSDQRLLELLWSGAKDFTFVPMGGKQEVGKAATILNQIISERLVGLPVCAIVDADLDIDIQPSAAIKKWEYCTIENALLDPISICEVLEPYKEKSGITNADQVEQELLEICRSIKQDETNKRLRKLIPPFHIQFKGTSISELEREREKGVEDLKSHPLSGEEITAQIENTTRQVEDMVSDKTAFIKFDGKSILGRLYQKLVVDKGVGMNFDVFCYSIAEKIGTKGRTPEPIKQALVSIRDHLRTNMMSKES